MGRTRRGGLRRHDVRLLSRELHHDHFLLVVILFLDHEQRVDDVQLIYHEQHVFVHEYDSELVHHHVYSDRLVEQQHFRASHHELHYLLFVLGRRVGFPDVHNRGSGRGRCRRVGDRDVEEERGEELRPVAHRDALSLPRPRG
jgi:hypothetical protein